MNSLLDLEQPLIDLKNMAGLIGHLSVSEREVTGQELSHIQTVLEECHEDLSTWWEEAAIEKEKPEEREAEVNALRAELAAVKASHAAPGSLDDIETAKAYWKLLVHAALVAIKQAEAAGVKPGAKPVAEGDGA